MIRRPASLAALAALLGLLVTAASAPAPAHADVDDFSFESFTADYYLGQDADGFSTLRTVEKIVALFPDVDQNRGIIRAIPSFDEATRVEEGVHVISVTNGAGTAVHYSTSRDGDFVDVSLGTDAYVHGRTTYVITYTQRYAAHFFDDTNDDEFYWDVNGDGWAQSFGSVTARVHLRDGLASKVTAGASCYVGYDGETGDCTMHRTGDGFSMTVERVGAFETATVAVGFRPHTFRAGPTADDDWRATLLPWLLLGLLGAIALLILVMRLFVWKDNPGRGIIVPRYEAPDGLGVLQSAELLHRSREGLPAEFVNFAVLGAAQLIEDPTAGPDERYQLKQLDPDQLTEPEDRKVFDRLFREAKKDVLTLDRADHHLGDAVQSVTASAAAALRTGKYLAGHKHPLTTVLRWVLFGIFAATVYLTVWSASNDVVGWIPLQILVLGVGSLVAIGFAGAPERLTARGAEARDQLLGIRMYLQLAEADRIRVLQSPTGAERVRVDPSHPDELVKLYEKLLPWAMVWGIEGQWATVLGTHFAATPTTSAGTGLPFASAGFLTGIGAFSHSVQASSFARTPSVSSSGGSWGSSGSGSFGGGSFGGGFSGGGFGGGGGGGR